MGDMKSAHESQRLLRMPGWALIVVVVVALWFVTTHFIHVFTEVINWDEFAMLERAERTWRFGKVIGDGRPGLISIALMPFVSNCVDAARSVVNARILWQGITLGYLVGVYFLVRRWFSFAGRPDEGKAEGLLSVALLAFLPAFVTWSVQVRSDQAALAALTWAGVLLMSVGPLSAVASGSLIAVGLLCTQKSLYVLGICGVLFATAVAARLQLTPDRSRAIVKECFGRLSLVALSAAMVVAIYVLVVPEATNVTDRSMILGALDTMQYSRRSQGFRIYTVHLDRLIVHWALFVALVFSTIRALRNPDRFDSPLVACSWLLLLLGFIVILVHGSSFPYFLMTAGLFPALALGMTAGQTIGRLGQSAWPAVAALLVMSALQSARESLEMFYDTQWEQRETLRLTFDTPLRSRRGYQMEGALLCTHDPQPFPIMFSPNIWQRFYGSPASAQNEQDFMREFRERPVTYIVESYRLVQLPEKVRAFLSAHYIWYARSLYIAGYNIDGSVSPRTVDVIVPGKYRWDADPEFVGSTLLVGGRLLGSGDTVELDTGVHEVATAGKSMRGQLILADLPRPQRDGYAAFYHHRQIAQLGGYR